MKMRNGKIARLPRHIREEINQRLDRCEPGPSLLAWLNALPEVQELVRAQFEGAPVSKHNLSQWRRRAFQAWRLEREFIAETRGEDAAPGQRAQRFSDRAATFAALKFARMLADPGISAEKLEVHMNSLGDLCLGLSELRKDSLRNHLTDDENQRNAVLPSQTLSK